YKVEGLFRKTGHCARQKALHQQLTAGATAAAPPLRCSTARTQPDVGIPDSTAVHDAANVLKMLLRGGDGQPSILNQRLVDVLLAIEELTSAESLCGRTDSEQQLALCRQHRALRLFQLLLPETNASALLSVLHLLSLVASCPETRMSVGSLGTVFGPVLLGGGVGQDQAEFHSLRKVEHLNRAVSLLISNCSLLSQVPRTFAEEVAGQWSALLLLVPDSAGSPIRFTRPAEPAAAAAVKAGDDPTAELCAHIRRMPESRRKRQLEKRLAEQEKLTGLSLGRQKQRQEPHRSLQKRLRLRSCTRLVTPAADAACQGTAEED
uniref:Rho-GAP domain-containing protein n=1 Tax=Macrostomum lignano TaxID=282301 RepID=A0A1I8HH71_9PLAT